MPRKFVVSPTKLRMFLRCPMEYRLEYVERLGRFYHRARAGHSFGHSLHRALDAFHIAGGVETVSADDLTATLETVWIPKGYGGEAQETAYREEGLRILQEYHAARTAEVAARAEAPEPPPPPPELLYTEKTLRLPLTDDMALSGRIDRVDQHHDGALEIVDYKSGRETVDEEDVAKSLAMGIYQLLLKHHHPDRRVFATLVALRTGARASWELSPEDREELLAECRETAETIKNKDWEAVLPVLNDHCPHCDFLPFCDRHFKKQARERRAAGE